MEIIIWLIHTVIRLFILLVIVKVVLSYFVSPYSPIRVYIDRIVEPMLQPIRRIMPSTGMIDFSPMVLVILLMILDSIITGFLRSLTI